LGFESREAAAAAAAVLSEHRLGAARPNLRTFLLGDAELDQLGALMWEFMEILPCDSCVKDNHGVVLWRNAHYVQWIHEVTDVQEPLGKSTEEIWPPERAKLLREWDCRLSETKPLSYLDYIKAEQTRYRFGIRFRVRFGTPTLIGSLGFDSYDEDATNFVADAFKSKTDQFDVLLHDCFISYSHDEPAFAVRLCEALKRRRFRRWIDKKEISPGTVIGDAVSAGLERSRTLILCCSARSLSSPWVESEFRTACNCGRNIIPINTDGHLFRSNKPLALEIRRRNAIDFSGWESDETKFNEQVKILARTLSAHRLTPLASG
jgi:hypothetical protein